MRNHLVLALILVLPLTLLASDRDPGVLAARRTFTKTSSVAQANQVNIQAENFRITDPADPFSFQKVGSIRKITRITITLTLFDGETGLGDADQGELTLALDGIDTGLLLEGFLEDGTAERTISGVPSNESQIRTSLKADGKLAATIIDASPGDNNGITSSAADTTTLVIEGKRRR